MEDDSTAETDSSVVKVSSLIEDSSLEASDLGVHDESVAVAPLPHAARSSIEDKITNVFFMRVV